MRRSYFRRARKDYPKGVLAIYDNGGKTADRYTVIYQPYYLPNDGEMYSGAPVFPYVGMSGIPFWPQSVCMSGETIGHRPYRASSDKVIRFEDLPEDCQTVVRRDLEHWEEGGAPAV